MLLKIENSHQDIGAYQIPQEKNNLTKWIGLTVTVAIVAMSIFQAYNYWDLHQTKEISCRTIQNGGIDFNYYNLTPSDAKNQYCLAEAYIRGENVQKAPSMARYWYTKALNQGLSIAQKALCTRQVFKDVPSQANFPEFEAICCSPVGGLGLCVWHEGYQSTAG